MANLTQVLYVQSQLDHMCALDIESRVSFVYLSGIICTIGSVSRSAETGEDDRDGNEYRPIEQPVVVD